MIYTLETAETLVLAIIALFVGVYLTNRSQFLGKYNIPVPVSGGLVVSVLLSIFYAVSSYELKFSLELRDFLLLAFFATVGLSAKIRLLISGGRMIAILIVLAVIYLLLQDFTGIFLAKLTGTEPAIGMLAGSVTLSGGHGTGVTYASIFENFFQTNNALEIAMASATFGLVIGGLVGGPLAHFLIKRHNLKPEKEELKNYEKKRLHSESVVDLQGMMETIGIISICILIGTYANIWMRQIGVTLPDFVPVLFTGVVIANLIDFTSIYKTNQKSLSLCSDLSLDLFLAMSLISLQLWTLVDLAGPLMLILAVQTVFALLFGYFVVFRAMGKNYTASVITAGYVGMGLGATPTAIANMSTVTQRYGLAPKAFIVIPLIGAFFIDIANAIVIQFFISMNLFH